MDLVDEAWCLLEERRERLERQHASRFSRTELLTGGSLQQLGLRIFSSVMQVSQICFPSARSTFLFG